MAFVGCLNSSNHLTRRYSRTQLWKEMAHNTIVMRLEELFAWIYPLFSVLLLFVLLFSIRSSWMHWISYSITMAVMFKFTLYIVFFLVYCNCIESSWICDICITYGIRSKQKWNICSVVFVVATKKESWERLPYHNYILFTFIYNINVGVNSHRNSRCLHFFGGYFQCTLHIFILWFSKDWVES